MASFEERLATRLAQIGALALVGLGCNGGDKGGTGDSATPDLAGMCAGDQGPPDYLVDQGFVTVTPGAPCPDAADAQLEVLGCTFLEWQGITCGFSSVAHDQVLVDDGYGGYWADAATAPTGTYPDVGPVVDVCFYDGVFYLSPDHPTCGRPLLREGEPVVAPLRAGASAWSTADRPDTSTLTPEDRRALAAYWSVAAQLEHASVASFSRFSLDLMRFGAPPELLHGAHQAALDEIAHARLCFGLAGAYAGAPLGPGPLDTAGVAGAPSLVALAEALFREGCVGETLAAVDAGARLVGARDAAVRAALATIVRDESAHAALAWRTLRWILDQDHDGAVRARLATVVAEERARWTAADAGDAVSPAGLAHGLLQREVRAEELARTWQSVIEPAWAAALAATPPVTSPEPPPASGPRAPRPEPGAA